MGITARHYIFAADDSLRRVPSRIAYALPLQHDAIPEFAGTTQKAAEVIVENEERKPVRILDVIGSFWTFDDEGKLDQEALLLKMGDYMDVAFSSRKTKREAHVVDLVPEIKKRTLNEKHRWTVTSEDLDRIAADLWPGINGPAAEVTTVKSKVPKAPPIPWAAKDALPDIAMDINRIKARLELMSEHDLRGLAFEALRTATFEDEALWKGVAEEAKRLKALKAVRRTGRGEWYAVVEAYRLEGVHLISDLATAHQKCSSREKAVEAGRRLLAEKADWLSDDTRVEVAIYSALEWQPDASSTLD